MVSKVLASVLQSYLGQYLELSDTGISVGSEICLNNVKLRESALADVGLPVKCVHGKVSKLVIRIPWFNLFTKKTTIDIEGLHLLMVPSTSVKYDGEKERREQNEAKQKRLQRIEDAKALKDSDTGKKEEDEDSGDTFTERLVANIIKNLEVNVRRVHIRYEDQQTNTGRYPFAAGVTLDSVCMSTRADTSEDLGGKVKLKLFEKHVRLDSFAVYWRPKANLNSEDLKGKEDVVDLIFDSNIGTKENPVNKLKYLLGPISSTATLVWCPNPAVLEYITPQVDLAIDMSELSLSLTKYQYQDFMMLLQSFEFMSRASKFRRYKARHGLENLPNYNGRLRDLWKFAFDCVYEEEVMRRINNWSWEHMKEHCRKCKTYRELYMQKLTKSKPSQALLFDLRKLEDALDEVNIRIQRQLAEREVDKIAREKAMLEAERKKSSGFWSWFGGGGGGSSSSSSFDEDSDSSGGAGAIKKLGEALTVEEKHDLYEVIDYQENAHHGIFPKTFVARKLDFRLGSLNITIRDEDWHDATVIKLDLQSVGCNISQRPSADYVKLEMTMESLTVTGLEAKSKKRQAGSPAPTLVATRTDGTKMKELLNFSFENNPPNNPDDLEAEEGSFYDQRVRFFSSPLEIVYDKRTFDRLEKIFKAPELVNLSNLQANAASKLREYREATTLSLQYVIDHHNLVDVDIQLMSSYIILPHKGLLTPSSACVIANLGSIQVKSKPISVETKELRELSLSDLTEAFKKNLRDQAYDKFNVSLENMQVIVALPNENWRVHVDKEKSPLFLLKPTSLKVTLQQCLIKNDPDMPLTKVTGSLQSISINVSDYRLIKMAQIIDSVIDTEIDDGASSNLHRADSEISMASALSSLANTGSLIQNTTSTALLTNIVPGKKDEVDSENAKRIAAVKLTKFMMDFKVGTVNLSLTQMEKSSNSDQELFHFTLSNLVTHARVRTMDFVGTFNIGNVTCEHLLLKTPTGQTVPIMSTLQSEEDVRKQKPLLNVTYTDVNKNHPDFRGSFGSVIKKIDVRLSSVAVSFHQDAIMDLVDKVNKFINELSANAKALLNTTTGTPVHNVSASRQMSRDVPESPPPPAGGSGEEAVALRRQHAGGGGGGGRKGAGGHAGGKKRLSLATSTNLARWAYRAKKRSLSKEEETIEMKVVAVLESVSFNFMTSTINFAIMRVRDLESTYVQTKTNKVITAKLVNFQVLDAVNTAAGAGAEPKTHYEYIAESMDEKVFDAKITLFDHSKEAKAADVNAVDVKVEASMGRIKLVFLMKFVNDFLKFLEPFSGAKEIVAEKANLAFEDATKSMIDAYANSTRAQLDIKMDAPVIIIPVHSRHSSTLLADLGTLTLSNHFVVEDGLIFDDMHFTLKHLLLQRAKISEVVTDNDIQACCPLIQPITFELNVKRNMNGAKKKTDPAELVVTGTLYEIKLEMSKEDYNVTMALLQSNFSEKGEFDTQETSIVADAAANKRDSTQLKLPIKSKYSGSRSSLASDKSLHSLRTAIKVPERDPEARAVEFNFKFRGLQAKIFSGRTPLSKLDEKRNPHEALANFRVKVLGVDGHMLVSGAIAAKAYLENCVLEDCREGCTADDETRIVRLMEAKTVRGAERTRMIDIDYKRDPETNQTIEVNIYSFILVGSVSYLLEIANFFVPEAPIEVHWKGDADEHAVGKEVLSPDGQGAGDDQSQAKMTVFVKIDEPDIFLVENIDDINSDALMLNTELQFKLWSAGQSMSMMASLTNIRCHTCRFAPALREASLAQILQPCTLSFTVSQNEGHGMRVNMNMSDLCLNVSPHSIAIIQKSVQAFIESMAKKEADASCVHKAKTETDHSQLWMVKPFKEDDHWFLKAEESLEAYDALNTYSSSHSGAIVDEQAIININNLVVRVEAGVGNNTIPLVLLESSFNCDVRNWSTSRMSAIGSMNLELAYYNSTLALWEPVIEPVCKVKPNGELHKKRWDMNITLQSNSDSDFGSAFVSPSYDDVDGFICPENLPPLMVLSLQSREVLEVTVSKTFIGVLSTLAQSFQDVTSIAKKELPVAPFIIQNRTGKTITLTLNNKGFKYYKPGDVPGRLNQLEVPHDTDVNLFLFKDRSEQRSEYVSPLQQQTEQAEASLRLRVAGETGTYELPVSKADKRFFPFQFRGDEMGDNHGMISEVRVDNGCKFVTLRSIIQIKNHFDRTVNIFVYDGQSDYIKLCSLAPDKHFDVPINHVYSAPYEFYFQIDDQDQNMGLESFFWRELMRDPSHMQHVQCTNRAGQPDIFLNVKGCTEEIFTRLSGKLTSIAYSLDIRPLLVFKNCLPITLHYGLDCPDDASNLSYIEPGMSAHMQGVRLGVTELFLKMFEFRSSDWVCRRVIEERMPELGLWRFETQDPVTRAPIKFDLGVNCAMSHGTQVISIYSPFWMVNKTGKHLVYKGQDPLNMVYHPVEMQDVPMMFSYTAKTFLGKKKASVRIEDSAWSDPFTLDTIEDAGKVTCKKPGNSQRGGNSGSKQAFSVGVNIAMSKSSLTKIITFTPFYIILNTAEFSISVKEVDGGGSGGEALEIPPSECVPFWPVSSATKIVAFVTGHPEDTTPVFSMATAHSTLLMLGNRFGAIHADCRTSNSETLLTLSSYSKGLAPVLLINHTGRVMIEFSEKGVDAAQYLGPMEDTLYTWRHPDGPRALVWAVSGYREEFINPLIADGLGIVELDEGQEVAWVSFLDGMQRVLLFTEDRNLCYKLAHSTGENERIEMEIDMSIFGVGISIVNNALNCNYEVIYVSISSSDIVWEIRKQGKSRYKSLTSAQCEALERDFQTYMREKSIGKSTREQRTIQVGTGKQDLLVNYQESKMFRPHEGKLRRQFQKGLWLQMRTSAHQRQIHAKVHRIQIDNQMRACLFPVIMAPVPPPKSVVADSIPKPFIELSVLQYMSPEHTSLRQFKYICALVQELHIKVDQGLLNAYNDLFEEEEILDEDIVEFLNEDLTLSRKPLKEIAKLRVTMGQKDFFDNLHLSPLKVHVSFSLTSYKSSKTSSRRSNFFGLFLQSLGVTITDTDDIIFRLAYFERKHQFYSPEDLLGEMIRHYTGQAIKQAYVFIFGLDVIGNPLGLVVGVSRSVEDLFYEPFQGAVEGPSEFAEGLAIGMRSVFSGVVGGAAGTVSKITGALGKGLASLTFDEKFQQKRREQIKKRGRQTLGESFARSGKGLVMGFFDGATGVVTKPVEGAMDEGVGGFFKGVGKGVVGLVARPTGGIVDFASGTFDSVKRAAEVTEEVARVRPARFLHPDRVVRTYNHKEAMGNKILKDLDKGRYAESDVYVTHDSLDGAKHSIFLVTNKRVLFGAYNQVLGTWTTDWDFEYAAIEGPPPTGQEDDGVTFYLVIKPREERKKVLGIFGPTDRGKKVFVSSREAARKLARVIESMRLGQN